MFQRENRTNPADEKDGIKVETTAVIKPEPHK